MSELVLDHPVRPLVELIGAVPDKGPGGLEGPLDCGFDAASITAAIGVVDAGRTALLDVIAGLTPLRSGVVRMGGLRIDRLGPSARVRLGIATMPRRPLASADTLFEMLAAVRSLIARPWWRICLGIATGPSRTDVEDIHATLSFLDIGHLAGRPVQGLGGLEARLADLARCLVQRPRILLLHHPLAMLAAADREALARVLARLRDAEIAVVVVDNDLSTLGRLADRCLVLHQGRLIADATPAAIGAAPHVFRALTGSEL